MLIICTQLSPHKFVFSKENSGIFSSQKNGKYREFGQEVWETDIVLPQILCDLFMEREESYMKIRSIQS